MSRANATRRPGGVIVTIDGECGIETKATTHENEVLSVIGDERIGTGGVLVVALQNETPKGIHVPICIWPLHAAWFVYVHISAKHSKGGHRRTSCVTLIRIAVSEVIHDEDFAVRRKCGYDARTQRASMRGLNGCCQRTNGKQEQCETPNERTHGGWTSNGGECFPQNGVRME